MVKVKSNDFIHLLLKYSSQFYEDKTINTIKEHMDLYNEKGKVIWGQFTKGKSSNFSRDKINKMDKQRAKGIPTFVFFYDSKNEILYRGDYIQSYSRKEINFSSELIELIPSYYHHLVGVEFDEAEYTCQSYVKVSNLQEININKEKMYSYASGNKVNLKTQSSVLYIKIDNALYSKLKDDYNSYPENVEIENKELEDNRELDDIKLNKDSFDNCLNDSPEKSDGFTPPKPSFKGKKGSNYIKNAKNNKKIGDRGEEFIIEYEKYKLKESGQKKLIPKIEHVAKTKGDGIGYDIKSFDKNGDEIFIEVKTTKNGKRFPFEATRNEMECSKIYKNKYYLYRVYNFEYKKGTGDIYIEKETLKIILTIMKLVVVLVSNTERRVL